MSDADDSSAPDELHAPVPVPGEDLSDLTVFTDDDQPATAAPELHLPDAAYDQETDLALPVAEPDAATAFVPFGGQLVDHEPTGAYDLERDTGI